VFRDLELGKDRKAPRRPQAVVITQSHQAQFAAAELPAQVPLHTSQVIRLGGDVQRVDHDLGGLIRRQGGQKRAPQLPPGFCWQQVVLQLGAQQRPGLAAQALDHMAEVDPPQAALVSRSVVQPRQGFDVVAAQEQIQPVVAQMDCQLLADQA
jgi:hypothetical protein